MTNPDEAARPIIRFYWEPGEQTCKDARVFIEARRCVPQMIDIRFHAPPEWAVAKAVERYGAKTVLNSKTPKFREMGLAKRDLSDEEAVKLLLANPELITRPVALRNHLVAVGLDKQTLLKMCQMRPAVGQLEATPGEARKVLPYK